MSYEVKLSDEIEWGSLSCYMLDILEKTKNKEALIEGYPEYIDVAIQFIDSILGFKKYIDRLDIPKLALNIDKWPAYNCAKAVQTKLNRDNLSLENFLSSVKNPLEEMASGHFIGANEIVYLESFFGALNDYCGSRLGVPIEGGLN